MKQKEKTETQVELYYDMEQLKKMYPKIDQEILSIVYLSGYNTYRAKITSKTLRVLQLLGNTKAGKIFLDVFREEIYEETKYIKIEKRIKSLDIKWKV